MDKITGWYILDVTGPHIWWRCRKYWSDPADVLNTGGWSSRAEAEQFNQNKYGGHTFSVVHADELRAILIARSL